MTEGLLLLTNDGELKRQLELPSTGVVRSYRARAFGAVTQAQLEELAEGVTIEGVRYGSIDANLERRTGRNAWIEMKLAEGKNREVRRVLAYLGLQVSRLIRTAYGPLTLAGLDPGAVEEVAPRSSASSATLSNENHRRQLARRGRWKHRRATPRGRPAIAFAKPYSRCSPAASAASRICAVADLYAGSGALGLRGAIARRGFGDVRGE